jgi:hypothetical protein
MEMQNSSIKKHSKLEMLEKYSSMSIVDKKFQELKNEFPLMFS